MSLSNDLISQFVKATKDTDEKKTETTIYGTTVEYEGRTFVKLDGSDRLTPVSTTATVKPDERVSVTIKNHSAIITGNLSDPSASSSDVSDIGNKISNFEIVIANKVDTDELVAESARIDSLVADNVTIKETLTAQEGYIDDLEADNVTIHETLTAQDAAITTLQTEKLDADVADITYATITNLEATNADIHNLDADYAAFKIATTDQLTAQEGYISELQTGKLSAADAEITYAKITDLNATNANVTNLTADVADIDTLIFGSASGETIQTSFANAVIAQLGNAQIKSAMIENIAASKITSGDIITNNVHVKSEDGKLLISDETIQISDNTRVRVQIGKDAAGDYSINVWDADGNLMFSEGGITDNAIKEAIIRDDMVSETANISASKLNIESLFEEINNDGSHTLNSSKILMDAEGQTLDVSFTNMTTSVTNAQNTANAAQAAANQNAADMANIVTDFNSDVANLQTQIDGSISTWFYEVPPTTSNEPAANWTTTDLKNNHLGDLYYDTITGYCYRWQVQDNIYSWQRITDTDVTRALADSAAAQDTADQKRRVFYSQPTTPYDKGDLWVQGSDGDILRCQTPKTSSQSYSLSDWVLASKYTDDTKADAAQAAADQNASDIATVTETVTTQGTSISVIQGQISSKIWQQDITTVKNELDGDISTLNDQYSALDQTVDGLSSTVASHTTQIANKADSSTVTTVSNKVTTLEQSLDGFQTTVSNTYATKTEVDNSISKLEIGGKNYLLNSEFDSSLIGDGKYWVAKGTYEILQNYYLDKNVIHATNTSTSGSVDTLQQVLYSSSIAKRFEFEGTWTFSFYCKGSGTMTTCIYPNLGNNENYKYIDGVLSGMEAQDNNATWTLTDEWVRHTYTFTFADTQGDSRVDANVLFRLRPSSEIYIAMPQFEKGSKATSYEPAIEDRTKEISSLGSRITTAESSITQNANEIATKVTQTEIDTAINNVQIGGRNLLLNTSTNNGEVKFYGCILEKSNIKTITNVDGVQTFSFDNSSNSGEIFYRFSSTRDNSVINVLEKGQEYTFSGKVKVSITSGTFTQVTSRSQSAVDGWGYSYLKNICSTTDEWASFSHTVKVNENAVNFYASLQIYFDSNCVGTLQTKELKFEKGNKATDWTPAPEDTDSQISDLGTRLTTAESSITQNANEIATKVSQTEYETDKNDITTRLSSAESSITQNANEIATKVSQTEIDTAISKINIGATNLASSSYITESDATLVKDGYTYNITVASKYGGLIISSSIFEVGKTYTLSYKYQKTDGTLESIGGHVGGFSGANKVYIDGVSSSKNYSSGIAVSDDTDEHELCFISTYYGNNSAGNNNLYIQPNRLHSSTASVTLKIWDIQVEEGNIKTDWKIPQEDIDSDISSLTTRVTSAESSITQNADAIELKVSQNGVIGAINVTPETITIDADRINLEGNTTITVMQDDIDDAAKTATNYLNFSSSGLVVGDHTADTLGKNVHIDSDSVEIRNGTATLASFGANQITLGQNSADSVIDLCDGAGSIRAVISEVSTSYPEYDSIEIESQKITTSSQTFRSNVTCDGSAYKNSGKVELVTQSSTAGGSSILNSQCTEVSSGDSSSTGMSALTTSSMHLAHTTIHASFYDKSAATTTSNQINVYPTHTSMSQPISMNGVRITALNNVLWSGVYHMNGSQTIALSAGILDQVNGILLVFSRYINSSNTVCDYGFSTHFVTKKEISLNSGAGRCFIMSNDSYLNLFGAKYLFISNTGITGHANNSLSGSGSSGISYSNGEFVLRYVIGV